MSSSPSPSFLSESEMEEIRTIAIRIFSSVSDGVAPPLQDGDLVTVQIEELYRSKEGTFPASKAAIAALPEMTITAVEEEGGSEDCAICLTEYVAGDEVKEMLCKHRYHSGCIGKWLRIHGSCPLCRYEMPVDDDDDDDEQIMVVNVFIQRAGQTDPDNGAPDNDDSEDSLDSEDIEIDYNGSSMQDVDD